MLAFLLRLIPPKAAAWLAALPWRAIGLGLLALAAVLAASTVLHWRADAGRYKATAQELASERACLARTACADRMSALAIEGTAAVDRARQASEELARRERADLEAKAQAAIDRARAASRAAEGRRIEAEAKLRRALATDASCAAQAREPIACDYF